MLIQFIPLLLLLESYVIIEYIKLCCATQNLENYDARVVGVVNDVPNKDLLYQTLAHLFTHGLSPYDYNRLSFVLEQLLVLKPDDQKAKRSMAILNALKTYERHSLATKSELEQSWKQLESQYQTKLASGRIKLTVSEEMPSYQQLKAVFIQSKERLPLHPLVTGQPWQVLLPELREETISLLLPLAAPLNITMDDFYMNLVDNMLQQWVSIPHIITVYSIYRITQHLRNFCKTAGKHERTNRLYGISPISC